MGRTAAPYTIYAEPKTGAACINARFGGRRFRESLGLDFAGPSEHQSRVREAAAKAYARIVEGRSLERAPTGRVQTAAKLSELVEAWAEEDVATYPASFKTTLTHAAHFEEFAEHGTDRRTPLERLTSDTSASDFVLFRLRRVLKETVVKEVSTLFRFYEWAVKNHHLASVPPRPKWPKKAVGVRSGTQRAEPVDASHQELEAIIAALPEWTARGGRNKNKPSPKAIPCRDLGALAYDTGLRPSTIARLEGGVHYRKGAQSLWIPPEIDKGRNKARYVPLTARAARIMLKHYKPGIIFGRHDLRVQWKRAAAKVLRPDQRPEDFSVYDYRHGAGYRFTELGGVLAAQEMLGHKRVTTTNRYVRSRMANAQAAVDIIKRSEERSERKPARKRRTTAA